MMENDLHTYALFGLFLCFIILSFLQESRLRKLESKLHRLIKIVKDLKPSHSLLISFYVDGKKEEAMNLKVSQELPISIVAEDEFGNKTGAVDAPPAWSLTDPTLGDMVAAEDGLSAVLLPSGKLGNTQVQVLATADGKTIMGSLDMTFIPGDATQLVLQAGVPTDVPAPAPQPEPTPAPEPTTPEAPVEA